MVTERERERERGQTDSETDSALVITLGKPPYLFIARLID